MSRTVIVASSASNRPVKINDFEGKTWGELRSHEKVAPLVSGNVEAILRQGNVTLSRNDAQLPEGDVTVFLVPTKNKAGIGPDAAATLGKEIADAIVKAASVAGERDIKELKEDLVEDIADFFDLEPEQIAPQAPTAGVSIAPTNGQELSEEDRKIMEEFKSFSSAEVAPAGDSFDDGYDPFDDDEF